MPLPSTFLTHRCFCGGEEAWKWIERIAGWTKFPEKMSCVEKEKKQSGYFISNHTGRTLSLQAVLQSEGPGRQWPPGPVPPRPSLGPASAHCSGPSGLLGIATLPFLLGLSCEAIKHFQTSEWHHFPWEKRTLTEPALFSREWDQLVLDMTIGRRH